MIVKIVYDELVNILGSKNEELNLQSFPSLTFIDWITRLEIDICC